MGSRRIERRKDRIGIGRKLVWTRVPRTTGQNLALHGEYTREGRLFNREDVFNIVAHAWRSKVRAAR